MTNKDSHHTLTYHHMRKLFIGIWLLGATVCQAQNLTLNDLDYFECQGVNVLVFSNPFNGGFNDEKNSGIEITHHGVRTIQGGFDKYIKDIYRVANWLYGCHPYHNYSFVAVVGATRPKQVFYGNNRADFSFIPGNVAPGLLFRKPDHFENFDDWPFLWGQNEGTIAGNTQYVIFGSSLKNIIQGK